ncbi:MAG TPA: calcium-binding protein, partial [Solirubrobacteraceae bacterium]|nr:calcium-binding protein [Solirubrobacteraceae bacterium]
MPRAILVMLVLILAAPPAALAGTVSLTSVGTDPKYPYEQPALSFVAGPGERNQIVLAQALASRPPAMIVADAGAPVQAGAGCTAIDQHTASCLAYYAYVDAGDGDDSVTVHPSVGFELHTRFNPYVRGGDGRDVLAGHGELAGGPGDDVLSCSEPCEGSLLLGGAGSDVLRGGNGDDVLSGDGDGPPQLRVIDTVITESGPAGNDTIDGGGGRDRIRFDGRAAGVRVDLAAGTATGAAGDRDRLAGIEDAIGGDGDDILLGDGGANQLEGDAGDDRVAGRGGNDYLLGDLVPDTNDFSITFTPGSDGADTLRGGLGDDVLDAGRERGDAFSGGPGADVLRNDLGGNMPARSVRCGDGRDIVDFAPVGQRLTGCEQLRTAFGLRMAIRPQRRAGGRLRFAWTCQRGPACAIAIGVRVGSTKLARRRLRLAGRSSGAFLIRPARAAGRGDVVDVT